MVGGCLPLLPCFSKYSLLLSMVVLHGVESDSTLIIHKTVGDTVELPSGLTGEGDIVAHWKYGTIWIADWDGHDISLPSFHQFEGRLVMNQTKFSLTVKSLKLQDSGNFTIVSSTNDVQNPTKIIFLQVHEVTKKPILNIDGPTWRAANNSCTVSLQCNTNDYSNVNYTWTLRNQAYMGSSMHFSLQPSEGDITVTCTTSNGFRELSTSQTVSKCSKNTTSGHQVPEAVRLVIYVAMSAGFTVVLVVTVAVVIYRSKQRQADSATENTIYADLSDNIEMKDVRSNSLANPSSIYETINDPVNLTSPHTIYDKIQFDRPTGVSTSPFQNVC